MHLLKIIPSLFTAANLGLGFVSIIQTIQGNYDLAAGLLIISFLMDGIDGRIARRINVASDFGLQFDSLADLVSFGVAPAVFAMEVYLSGAGIYALAASILFILAGAGRLARYNMLPKTPYFIGLPIPAAGITLITFYLAGIDIGFTQALVMMLLLAFLMISKIKYPNFNIVLSRPRDYFRTHSKSKYFAAFLLGLGILFTIEFSIDPSKLLLVPLLYYVIVGPIVAIRN